MASGHYPLSRDYWLIIQLIISLQIAASFKFGEIWENTFKKKMSLNVFTLLIMNAQAQAVFMTLKPVIQLENKG